MRKTHRVELTTGAQRDIREFRDYIARDKPGAAKKWGMSVRAKVMSLGFMPERFEVIPEPDFTEEYRHLIFGSYRIIFRIDQKRVIVVRVFHASRRLMPHMLPEE